MKPMNMQAGAMPGQMGAMPKNNMATAAMPVKGIAKPAKAKKVGKKLTAKPQQIKPILPPAFYGR